MYDNQLCEWVHVCWLIALSMQVELPGGGVRRRWHAAAAVRSGSTVYVIEFGGQDSFNFELAATTVLQISKYMAD